MERFELSICESPSLKLIANNTQKVKHDHFLWTEYRTLGFQLSVGCERGADRHRSKRPKENVLEDFKKKKY